MGRWGVYNFNQNEVVNSKEVVNVKITEFAKLVAAKEGKKVPVNIAQISEILKVINELTKGLFYCIIKWL
jgi:hypothetical protein